MTDKNNQDDMPNMDDLEDITPSFTEILVAVVITSLIVVVGFVIYFNH